MSSNLEMQRPNNRSNNQNDLRKVANNAKRYVLMCCNPACTNHYQDNTTTWCRNDEYAWLLDLQCSVCKREWSICCECSNVKTAFTTDCQVRQHRYTYHNPNRPNKRKKRSDLHNTCTNVANDSRIQPCVERKSNPDPMQNEERIIDPDEGGTIPASDCEELIAPPDDPDRYAVDIYDFDCIDSIHRVNAKTASFYSYDFDGSGKKYLISRMNGNPTSNFGNICGTEVNYQIQLARFVSSLTIRQQRQFASLLTNFKNVYLTQNDDNRSLVCKIPSQLSDLRRMYTEGENSIDNHLPVPDCIMIGDHSYVSITDCIADVLLRNNSGMTSVNDWGRDYFGSPIAFFR
jgi:hypothetical protein